MKSTSKETCIDLKRARDGQGGNLKVLPCVSNLFSSSERLRSKYEFPSVGPVDSLLKKVCQIRFDVMHKDVNNAQQAALSIAASAKHQTTAPVIQGTITETLLAHDLAENQRRSVKSPLKSPSSKGCRV